MAIELLATNIELGLVTTNLDAMVGFYEGFLGLPHQGDLDFPGGNAALRHRQQRARWSPSTSRRPPRLPAAVPPRPSAYTLVVSNVTTAAEQVKAAGYEIAQELAEFAPVPGMGWMFVADPDGNWVELVGPL
jgi:predicted enzyme related to lactoylglutathione lyase